LLIALKELEKRNVRTAFQKPTQENERMGLARSPGVRNVLVSEDRE
jgi:hypothetical protein